MGRDHAQAIVEMRATLLERGLLSNRDFQMVARTRTDNYRGRKDSVLALYYLWRTGEVMTHHRERVYALTEQVAPANLIFESSEIEADRFLVKKEISFGGLSRVKRTSDSFRRGEPDRAAKRLLETMQDEGAIIEVKVEGWKAIHLALGSDTKTLLELNAARVECWAHTESLDAARGNHALKVYAHLFEEQRQEATISISDFLGSSLKSLPAPIVN